MGEERKGQVQKTGKKKTSTKTAKTATNSQKTNDDPLKPRRMCNCQATSHRLLGNCLRCGKIICQEEGEGPCLFCELVLRPKLERKGVDMEDELVKEPSDMTDEELSAFITAQDHKEKLLEFDRNRAKRTLVFDDQADYYSMDSTKWLTAEQRSKLESYKEEMLKRKIREASEGRSYEISIDLAGRQVAVHRPSSSSAASSSDDLKAIEAIMSNESCQQRGNQSSSSSSSSSSLNGGNDSSDQNEGSQSNSFFNPFLLPSARPLFVPTASSSSRPPSVPASASASASAGSRVQHNYFELEV